MEAKMALTFILWQSYCYPSCWQNYSITDDILSLFFKRLSIIVPMLCVCIYHTRTAQSLKETSFLNPWKDILNTLSRIGKCQLLAVTIYLHNLLTVQHFTSYPEGFKNWKLCSFPTLLVLDHIISISWVGHWQLFNTKYVKQSSTHLTVECCN